MNNIIQYFLENGIPGLEKIKKDFFTNPAHFDEYPEKYNATCGYAVFYTYKV